ncbi:peptidyl-prolyl cis-trans isomerase [Babesia caballi]|uniref:peptidylprolyl isomerase n=1 Tax=Babesia caballi TaxID=5871 RepID=A0AAV4LQL6_BABCB|nr:peptidyl-prolyl cis-trans isomerase [Babesia caballi]
MSEPIDLTGDSGVVKTILAEAKSDERPENGHEVEVHYTGKLDSGAVFDSSHKRETTFKFTLGAGNVIKGWDIGVASMKLGEKALFVIQPAYGYGEAGAGTSIPPNAVLHFEIELINSRPKPRDLHDMTTDEKIQAAADAKALGNAKFMSGQYRAAIAMYEDGLHYLSVREEWDEAARKASDVTKLQCHLNLANCYLKVEEYAAAENHATEALALEPLNVKGLYRRAVARVKTSSFGEALQDLTQMIKVEPKNADAVTLYQMAKAKLNEQNELAKKRYGNVFKNLSLYKEKSGIRDLAAMPRVYLDLAIGEQSCRLVIALFEDTVPKTVKNFQQLCDEKSDVNYKGNKFHRLIKGFMVQGGDVTNGDGTGGVSIYGDQFDDEAFVDQHTERGLLSMANCGPNTNNSQFFITFVATPHLNGKHVVFGKVVEGMEALGTIEELETGPNDRPKTWAGAAACSLPRGGVLLAEVGLQRELGGEPAELQQRLPLARERHQHHVPVRPGGAGLDADDVAGLQEPLERLLALVLAPAAPLGVLRELGADVAELAAYEVHGHAVGLLDGEAVPGAAEAAPAALLLRAVTACPRHSPRGRGSGRPGVGLPGGLELDEDLGLADALVLPVVVEALVEGGHDVDAVGLLVEPEAGQAAAQRGQLARLLKRHGVPRQEVGLGVLLQGFDGARALKGFRGEEAGDGDGELQLLDGFGAQVGQGELALDHRAGALEGELVLERHIDQVVAVDLGFAADNVLADPREVGRGGILALTLGGVVNVRLLVDVADVGDPVQRVVIEVGVVEKVDGVGFAGVVCCLVFTGVPGGLRDQADLGRALGGIGRSVPFTLLLRLVRALVPNHVSDHVEGVAS